MNALYLTETNLKHVSVRGLFSFCFERGILTIQCDLIFALDLSQHILMRIIDFLSVFQFSNETFI